MLTIVGLDPGTTLGLAILDLNSEIVYLDSFREHDLKKVIDKIFEFGRPLVLATDKLKVPTYVQNLSSRLGLKVITPGYDLLLTEKNEVNKLYDNICKNSHERDALTAAFFAYKALKSTIDKVIRNSPKEHFDKVLFSVINKEQNLASVLDSLTKKTAVKKFENKPIRIRTKDEIQRLSHRITELKSQIRLLKFETFELKSKLRKRNSEIKSLLANQKNKVYEIVEKKHSDLLKIINDKEQAIRFLSEQKESLEKEFSKLIDLLSSGVFIVVPKLDSLKDENQIKGKYVLINHFLGNDKLIQTLNEKGVYMLTKNRKLNSLIYIDKIYYETETFAILSLKDLEDAVQKKTKENANVFKIIEEYKKQRNKDL